MSVTRETGDTTVTLVFRGGELLRGYMQTEDIVKDGASIISRVQGDNVNVDASVLSGLIEQSDVVATLTAAQAEVTALTTERNNLSARQSELIAEKETLTTEKERLAADKAGLIAERDALSAEKLTLITERYTLTTERDALLVDKAALTSDKAALTAERDAALTAQLATIDALKEQVRSLKGTPKFKAIDLLAQITDAEKDCITEFVASSDTLRPLWSAFLSRVVGPPIAIDSPTFLAALDGLQQALGNERVAELFTALNIDLATGVYIDLTKAG